MVLVASIFAAAAVQAAPDANIVRLSPDLFRQAGAVNGLDVALRVPGFVYDRGAVVRGLADASGNVLIDGQRPVAKSDVLDEILRRIPLSDIAEVQVIRGSAPGIDMQGRTILVNIVLRRATAFSGLATASASQTWDDRTYGSVRFEGRWRKGEREFQTAVVAAAGADDTYGDGDRVRIAPDGTTILATKVRARSDGERYWLTGGLKTPLLGGTLQLSGAYLPEPNRYDIRETYLNRAGGEHEHFEGRPLQIELSSRYKRRVADLDIDAVLYQRFDDRDRRNLLETPAFVQNFAMKSSLSETVGRGTAQYQRTPALRFEFGAEAAYNDLDSRTNLTLNGAAVAIPAANVVVTETRGEVFGVAAWRPRTGLTVEFGLRQEGSRISSEGDVVLTNEFAFLKPRVSLTWDVSATTQVRARVERVVGQIKFADFTASPVALGTGVVLAGNPDLAPQQAWVSEVASQWRSKGGLTAEVLYRHSALKDVIDRIPVTSATGVIADAAGNIGSGDMDEFQATLSLPLGPLGLRGGLIKGQATYRHSEVTDPTTGEARDISALHPVDWEVRFSHDLPKFNASWGVDVNGGYRERLFRLATVQTTKISPYVTLYVDWKLRPGQALRLEVQNLTSRSIARHLDVYGGPRDRAALAYREVRTFDPGPVAYIRFRRSLGVR